MTEQLPKLGRNKPTERERSLLARLPGISAYVRPEMFTAPPLARYWSTADGTPYGQRKRVSMFANDRLGDCTCATLAHQDQIAAQQVGEVSPLTDADVIALYERSGYHSSDPSSDQGWTNIEAARAALEVGWVSGFVRFDCTKRTELEIVVNEFGCAMVGIDLPVSAQGQMGTPESGKIWDSSPDGKTDGAYKIGSWGGHAVAVTDCDADGVTLATWGRFQRASWSFVATYFDDGDGIALLNRYWRKRDLAPSGLRLDELEADMLKLNIMRWV